MKKLIVNADDFGFNRQVTDGIVECHLNGCVTSATLMAHMPAAEYAAAKAKELPRLSVGIHLAINTGKPISSPQDVPSLVDEEGNFKPSSEIVRLAKKCKLPVREIETEFEAQIKKFLDMGLTPSHCDSHQNITVNPQPFVAMLRLIKKYKIRKLRTYRGWYRSDSTGGWSLARMMRTARVNLKRGPKQLYYSLMHYYLRMKGYQMPDEKTGFYKFVGNGEFAYNLEDWERFVTNLPDCTSEFVSHPGFASEDPWDRPVYRAKRVEELALLKEPESRSICEKHGVKLVNFNDL